MFIFYDLILIAFLLLFALLGARKGLILTLSSLLSLVVALIGSILVSNLLTPCVSTALQPILYIPISQSVESALPEYDATYSLEEIVTQLDQTNLPLDFHDLIGDIDLSASMDAVLSNISTVLSEKAAYIIAQNGLFILSFVLILFLWKILGWTVNLVTYLPGLHTLNTFGGFLLGALRGLLILYILLRIGNSLTSNAVYQALYEKSILFPYVSAVIAGNIF